MGIRSYNDLKEHIGKNEVTASVADIIGKDATKDLEVMAETSGTWIDVTDVLKKKYNLTGFQLGILLGYFMAYQSAMKQFGVMVGGR